MHQTRVLIVLTDEWRIYAETFQKNGHRKMAQLLELINTGAKCWSWKVYQEVKNSVCLEMWSSVHLAFPMAMQTVKEACQ